MAYKLINREYLDTVSEGDPAVVRDIVDIFREQSVEIYVGMNSLLQKKEYYELGLLAHKAKSSVAIMGIGELAAMLKKFELLTRESAGIESYQSHIERFRTDTDEALVELEDLIENMKAARNDHN
jgi:HPt (histidine-containing phosphotransfer) domain-containing protein